jgi:hypothetical protein
MDTKPTDLLTAFWASGDADSARVAADALLESGDLPDRLRDLSAEELADVLQKFRAVAMTMPALGRAFGAFVETATNAMQAFGRALGEALRQHDGNFPP